MESCFEDLVAPNLMVKMNYQSVNGMRDKKFRKNKLKKANMYSRRVQMDQAAAPGVRGCGRVR